MNLVSDVPHSSRCPLSICVAENDVTVVVFNVFLRKINFGFVVVAYRTVPRGINFNFEAKQNLSALYSLK